MNCVRGFGLMAPRGWDQQTCADHGREGGDGQVATKKRKTSTLVELVDKILEHPKVNKVLVGMILALVLVVIILAK